MIESSEWDGELKEQIMEAQGHFCGLNKVVLQSNNSVIVFFCQCREERLSILPARTTLSCREHCVAFNARDMVFSTLLFLPLALVSCV